MVEPFILGDGNLHGGAGEGLKAEVPIRKSVTVRSDLDTRVRDLLAACTRHRINLDYTKALNLFAELGEKWMETSTPESREKYREVLAKYLDEKKFEDSVMDEWLELEEFRQWKIMKNRLDSTRGKGS